MKICFPTVYHTLSLWHNLPAVVEYEYERVARFWRGMKEGTLSTFLRERQMGCLRSLTIQVIAPLIVIPLAVVLIFVPLCLVTQLEMSIWWLIVPAGLFVVILVGGGIATVALVLVRRARRLDALFAPLGLTGQTYMISGRQYHGTIQGRQVNVYFYRGPTLNVDISTPLQTRLGVASKAADTMAFARLLNRQPLSLADPALSDMTVFAMDEDWTRSLLANPHMPGRLQRLIHFEGFFTRRNVLLRPGWLRLSLYGNRNLFRWDITPEQVQQWFDNLLAVARIAEGLPAPQITDQESEAERMARSIRNRSPYLIPAIAIGVTLAIVLCSGGAGVAAFLWAISQQPQ